MESGGDPSVQPYDTELSFPLFYAAAENHPEICELLLRFGANLDQKFKGFTSLQAATIHNKHTKVIEVLQAATDNKNDERKKGKKINGSALAALA